MCFHGEWSVPVPLLVLALVFGLPLPILTLGSHSRCLSLMTLRVGFSPWGWPFVSHLWSYLRSNPPLVFKTILCTLTVNFLSRLRFASVSSIPQDAVPRPQYVSGEQESNTRVQFLASTACAFLDLIQESLPRFFVPYDFPSLLVPPSK